MNELEDNAMPKTQEDLDTELCQYCPCTEFGSIVINTGPWNLCEGCMCDTAYQKYLDDHSNLNDD